MKRNPFGQKPFEAVVIGNERTGFIHLMKRNAISPAENPVDMQEAMKRQGEATLIFLEAVKTCAAKHGISNAQAREMIFPTPDENGVTVESADLYDYLEPKDAARLMALQEDGRKVAQQAATLFLQHRLVYAIEVTTSAKAKANQLEVKPLTFQVAGSNQFKFGDQIVEVNEAADFDATTLQVEKLDRRFESGEVGYLCDVTGNVKVGDPSWTPQDTLNFLTEEQIETIYQFYQSEIGQAPSPDAGEENLTTRSPASLNPSTANQLTGAESTGASSNTASETSDSTPTTLETSPTG